MALAQDTPYFRKLSKSILELGGMFNAHLHLDRVATYEATLELLNAGDDSGSHISLAGKHALIPMLHESDCYDPSLLEKRVQSYVTRMAALGTTRADTVVDVTDDLVQLGAFEALMRIKQKLAGKLDLRVGAYSPLGFRDDEPGRWELLEKAGRKADFLGALPERDAKNDYPEHIGFLESCRRVLELCSDLEKSVHFHVDQQNNDAESGTEGLIRLVKENGWHSPKEQEPWIWLVHVISPSAYDESRFQRMLADLAELNIGIICCPSAALSMRQLRPVQSPTHNSIARVLEMLGAGVKVRLGSDNISDITSPAGTIDLMHELFVLVNTVRYYDIPIIAKIAAGHPLNSGDRQKIRRHLSEDRKEVERMIERYRPTNN